jgi:hypothetical protein
VDLRHLWMQKSDDDGFEHFIRRFLRSTQIRKGNDWVQEPGSGPRRRWTHAKSDRSIGRWIPARSQTHKKRRVPHKTATNQESAPSAAGNAPAVCHHTVTIRDASSRGTQMLCCRCLIINALRQPEDIASFNRRRTCPLWTLRADRRDRHRSGRLLPWIRRLGVREWLGMGGLGLGPFHAPASQYRWPVQSAALDYQEEHAP